MSADGSEVRVKNETTGGEKGQKLDRFDLIPAEPLRQIARHYGVGARKYADRNWELGYNWDLSYGALMRHLNAWWGGEDIDEETGSSHLAAAAFHVLALLEFTKTHPELDTRPSTVAAKKVLEETLTSWRSVVYLPSVEFTIQEVSDDALSLFFRAKTVEASEGTLDEPVEEIAHGPAQSLDEFVSRAVPGQKFQRIGDDIGGSSQPTSSIIALATDERLREIAQRAKPLGGLPTPEPPEPKYQAGERASVRDIIRAMKAGSSEDLGCVLVEDEDDVAIVAPEGAEGLAVKNVVSILNALEDAGFQVTKA